MFWIPFCADDVSRGGAICVTRNTAEMCSREEANAWEAPEKLERGKPAGKRGTRLKSATASGESSRGDRETADMLKTYRTEKSGEKKTEKTQ